MKEKNAPVIIKILHNVADTNKGIIKLSKLVEYKGKKFLYMFENSNGTPCGFDYKHCIKVFNTESDEWKNLADKDLINPFADGVIDYVNYFGSSVRLSSGALLFMDACDRFVKMLYD